MSHPKPTDDEHPYPGDSSQGTDMPVSDEETDSARVDLEDGTIKSSQREKKHDH